MQATIVQIISLFFGSFILFLFRNQVDFDLTPLIRSLLVIGVLLLTFKVGVEGFLLTQIKDSKTSFTFRRISQLFMYFLAFAFLLNIWIDLQSVLVVLGVFSAALGLSFQPTIKNVIGGVTVLTGKRFEVGDRIQVGDIEGDIIDLDLMNTTLMEVGNWVTKGRPTGRIVTLPNEVYLSEKIFNSNQNHDYIWDEYHYPIPSFKHYTQSKKQSETELQSLFATEIENLIKQFKKLQKVYFVQDINPEVKVFCTTDEDKILLGVRYPTLAKDREAKKEEVIYLIQTSLNEK